MAELDPHIDPIPEDGELVVIKEVVYETLPKNRPRKVSASMWGPFEIAAVVLGVLALVISLGGYFLLVVPSNRELAKNKAEADRLEAEQLSAKSKYGEITTTQDQVGKLVQSVDDFETRFLPMPVNGQTALYQRLNGLIAAYDLENTTGPDYAPLETADQNAVKQSDDDKGRAKYRSLYPGVYVSTTLEGSYQNLRRFIREIETGRDFVIVSSVELAPSDSNGQEGQKEKTNPANAMNPAANTQTVRTLGPPPGVANRMMLPPGLTGAPPVGQPGFTAQTPPASRQSKGKMHGEVVSLHIELAAYFRRPGSMTVSTAK